MVTNATFLIHMCLSGCLMKKVLRHLLQSCFGIASRLSGCLMKKVLRHSATSPLGVMLLFEWLPYEEGIKTLSVFSANSKLWV